MNDLTHTIGLLRSEVRDARAIASNVDHKLTRLIEGANARPREGSIVARLAAAQLLAKAERRSVAAVAAQNWPHDIQLRSAVAPAMSGTSGWAAELVQVVTADIADRMLGASVFSQLRALGLAYDYSGPIVKVPSVQPVASGSFVGEGQPAGVGALLVTSTMLPAKKAISILLVTKELLRGSPASTEASLQKIMSEDVSLLVDGLLADANPADANRPAGLRNGIGGLTPSATGTPTEKVMADITALLTATMPCLRPVLIASTPQAISLSVLAPGLAVPVLAAPFLAAGTLILVDAAAFASVTGMINVETSEEAAVHMADTPLPIVGGTLQPPALGSIAAPVASLFQTASLGLKSVLDINWALRRSGSVSWMTGIAW
jgi:hypothetical protein